MKVYTIPKSARTVIDEYMNLPIGGKKIVAPYFINPKSQRAGLRVMVGKGDPGEIAREVKVLAQLKGIDLAKMNEEQIRHFMMEQTVGIDCSGFIVHVLNYWLREQGDGSLVKYLSFPRVDMVSKIKRFLRPVEQIGANNMTSVENCKKITNLRKVRPGDLIRSKGARKNAHHVILVSEVTFEEDVLKEIEYVHSISGYGQDNGVRYGKIIINDENGELKNQTWTEIQDDRNWTYEGVMKDYADNGIRRLKRVNLKYETYENA